jgi:hypothetical protein
MHVAGEVRAALGLPPKAPVATRPGHPHRDGPHVPWHRRAAWDFRRGYDASPCALVFLLVVAIKEAVHLGHLDAGKWTE